MSTRLRLALLLAGLVIATLAITHVVVRNAIFGPFIKEATKAYLDQVVYVTEELERGSDPRELEERLGLDIKIGDEAPPFVRRADDDRRGRCVRETHRGHEVVLCRGRKAPVAIRSGDRWVVVRRDLDVENPANRIGPYLLAVAIAVILIATWLSAILSRPIKASIGAMERIAGGDLSHRLPGEGPRELRDVAKAFNAMADRLETLLRAERELMAGISHELRTPLARLRLEIELLRDQPSPPEKRLSAMELDLGEMDRLIGELLEVSRLSVGERRLTTEPIALSSIVDEALLRQPLSRHLVKRSGEGATVEVDRERMIRLLTNLLQNAEKYAPAGTEVDIALEGKSIEVRDRGPGVAPDELPRLFEPFFRGARTTTSATGLGLGLMIARQVAILHGGKITAVNRDGGGLTIRLTLP